MSKNYYDILGVSKTATQEEIKRAFRKLAHQYHPDKQGGDEQKFKEINEAYQVLGNSEKRRQYDQFGQTFEQAQAQGGFAGFDGFRDFSNFAEAFRSAGSGGFNFGFEDLGDVFGDLFGFGGGSTRTRTRVRRGQDIAIQMALDFEEAAFGTEKEIEIEKNIVCPKCSGNGAEPGTKIETCKTCRGSGQAEQLRRTFLGTIRSVSTCPNCEGEGKVASQKCSQCRGGGVIRDKQNIKFKVPAGISAGKSIRLAGRGEAGPKGAGPGDLYITFMVREHPRFIRQGDSVISRETITFSQAALGDKIDIETLEGNVKLKIPAGTQSGKIFKLSDLGIPHLHGRGRGDHLVEIVVKTPERLTKKQKKLIEELRDTDD